MSIMKGYGGRGIRPGEVLMVDKQENLESMNVGREPAGPGVIARLEKSVTRVKDVLGELEGRLVPVMNPEAPQEPVPTGTTGDRIFPAMLQAVAAQTHELEAVAVRIRNMLDRCEL